MAKWNSILFIYNPKAGRGQIRGNLHTVIDTFSKSGAMVTVYPTKEKNDAYHLLRPYGNLSRFPYDLIAVSGGDGTLHEVVNAVMSLPERLHVPIGYIPAGSTNDFASSHTIPKTTREAAQTIVSGEAVPFDIGRFGDQYFTYVAAFGSLVDVSYDTPQDIKNRFGHFAYIMEGARRLNSYHPIHVRVDLRKADDTVETLEETVVVGLITNTYSVGGYAINTDFIDLHDGFSEMSLIRASERPVDYLPVITSVLNQEYDAEGIIYRKIRSARFVSEESIPWTLDGEYGGAYTDIQVDTCKDGVRFVV